MVVQTGLNLAIAPIAETDWGLFWLLYSLFAFHVFYLFLGMALRDYGVEFLRLVSSGRFLSVVGVMVGSVGLSLTAKFARISPDAWYYGQSSYLAMAPLMSVGMFILICGLANYLRQKGGPATSVLSTLGLYSYGIYLFHVVAVAAWFRVLRFANGLDAGLAGVAGPAGGIKSSAAPVT